MDDMDALIQVGSRVVIVKPTDTSEIVGHYGTVRYIEYEKKRYRYEVEIDDIDWGHGLKHYEQCDSEHGWYCHKGTLKLVGDIPEIKLPDVRSLF